MTSVPFDHLSREALDHELSPSRSAKDPWGVLRRHAEVTASLDSAPGLTVLRDLTYGRRSAERLDLVVPSGRGPYPSVAWFHGGFWQEGSKAGSGFAAPVLAESGVALAGVGYPLAPEVRLRAIVQSAGAALVRLQHEAPSYGLDPERIVVAGHSAGAHLAAAIVAGMAGEAAASAACDSAGRSAFWPDLAVAEPSDGDRSSEAWDAMRLRDRLPDRVACVGALGRLV